MCLTYTVAALLASGAEAESAVRESDDHCPLPLPEKLGIDLYEEPEDYPD